MIYLNCDYNEGAHPKVLERIVESNNTQEFGYGNDSYSTHAKELIKKAINRPDANIHFMVSGTPTNVAFISHILRPYETVICAQVGHINVHESGSVEARGHKVTTISKDDGKLKPDDIQNFIDAVYSEPTCHLVIPKMVYITIPTEIGTMYTKSELESIYKKCQELNLYLYIDGARLGYGLTSEGCDLDLETIANNCDAFYIGGTKCGALCGEAIVLLKDEFEVNFLNSVKQAGQLLAKGRLLGSQFEALFTNNLYFDICKNANRLAIKVRDALEAKGIEFEVHSNTNQQFPIFPNSFVEKLKDEFAFEFVKKIDQDHTCYRICTSWATKEENIDKLIDKINELL